MLPTVGRRTPRSALAARAAHEREVSVVALAESSPLVDGPPPFGSRVCDREPIHLIGQVLPHGVLVVVDLESELITHCSANIAAEWGVDPNSIIDASVSDVLAAESVDVLRASVANVRAAPEGYEVVGLTVHASDTSLEHRVDAFVSVDGRHVFVECEPHLDDQAGLLTDAVRASQQLALDAEAPKIRQRLVEQVRQITGFAHVMYYTFHADHHGEVVAESRDEQRPSYLGLHFPASDIPAQARALYRNTPWRIIPDVDAAAVDIVTTADRTSAPLDLSTSNLRAVSSFHLEYMRAMDTAASMSFPVVVSGELVGLVSCIDPRPRLVSLQVRSTCRLVVHQAAMLVAAADRSRDLVAALNIEAAREQLTILMEQQDSVAGALTGEQSSLWDLIPAEGILARVEGIQRSEGRVPPGRAMEEIYRVASAAAETRIPWVTDSLNAEFGDSVDWGGLAGAAIIPLGARDGALPNFVAWFRVEQVRTLRWLGDPRAKDSDGVGPRQSFEEWRETVRRRSVSWTAREVSIMREFRQDIIEALHDREQQKLAHYGLHDELTGLPNRRSLTAALARELQLGSPVTIMFADLDGFKSVNDTQGHEAGDQVLIEVARRLRQSVRDADVVVRATEAPGGQDEMTSPVGRLGGDEFVIVVPKVTDQVAEALTQRMRLAIEEPIETSRGIATVGVSVGWTHSKPEDDMDSVLGRADQAMYREKLSKRRP